MAPVLGYWDIRGLAQPVRLLLEYVGEEYEDKLYACGPAPDYDKSCWFNDEKFNLGLDFPNLPYYIDGDLKLTQSLAIIQHVARKHNMYGKNETESAHADMVANQIGELRGAFTALCYNPKFEELKPAFCKTLTEKLQLLEGSLKNKKWSAGENITYADFLVYEVLDQLLMFCSKCLEKYPNLDKLHKKLQSLETIKKYLASDKCIKKKLNNKMAQFGNGIDN